MVFKEAITITITIIVIGIALAVVVDQVVVFRVAVEVDFVEEAEDIEVAAAEVEVATVLAAITAIITTALVVDNSKTKFSFLLIFPNFIILSLVLIELIQSRKLNKTKNNSYIFISNFGCFISNYCVFVNFLF